MYDCVHACAQAPHSPEPGQQAVLGSSHSTPSNSFLAELRRQQHQQVMPTPFSADKGGYAAAVIAAFQPMKSCVIG